MPASVGAIWQAGELRASTKQAGEPLGAIKKVMTVCHPERSSVLSATLFVATKDEAESKDPSIARFRTPLLLSSHPALFLWLHLDSKASAVATHTNIILVVKEQP
jgi:hypothetical protein